MRLFLTIFFSISFVLAFGQKETQGVKKEGAHQAEYNANAPEKDHSAEVDSRTLKDGKEEETGTASNSSQGDNSGGDASPEQTANTAGTDTRTTSSSGSPALLATDGPDGTNTMQRATINIAGSPLPGRSGSQGQDQLDDRAESRLMEGSGSTESNDNSKKVKSK